MTGKVSIFLCILTYSLAADPEFTHDITCSPDANGILPISLVNNHGTEVNVTLECSNAAFNYLMAPGQLEMLPAFFYDWTNSEKVYPDSACVLMYFDTHLQGYEIHVTDGNVSVLNGFQSCNYSVGCSTPSVNHYADCPENFEDPFLLHLENTGDLWLYLVVGCLNNWFNFHVPPNSSISLPSALYEWTNYNKTYPDDVCVFENWSPHRQDAIVYSVQSDGDYTVNTPGCDVSHGADFPVVQNRAECPQNASEEFNIVLENQGDVWVYYEVWCSVNTFWVYLAPNTSNVIPAALQNPHDPNQIFPNDTCVFYTWEPGFQEAMVYAEESDNDYHYEYLSCAFSVGADKPQFKYTTSPVSADVINIFVENNGTVPLYTEISCWNGFYSYLLEPNGNFSLNAVYREWTNPERVYPENTCIMWDFEPQRQAVGLYIEEADLDYVIEYIISDWSVGENYPVVNHTSDCAVDESGLFSVTLRNTGSTWLFVELLCWNDNFGYFLPPGATEIVPAVFLDWANIAKVYPNNTCIFELYQENYQEIPVYSEEADWDYTYDYIGCDYSVGADSPQIEYLMKCPVEGDNFQIGIENTGDTWVYAELDCLDGYQSLYLSPQSTTYVNASYGQWTDPSLASLETVCRLTPTDWHYQDIYISTWESDWDNDQHLLSCNYSVGGDKPIIKHNTDCMENEDGTFNVNLVNPADFWLYVEVQCLLDYKVFYMAPYTNKTLTAMYFDWVDQEKEYPEWACVFEDWGHYQEIQVYTEEPDFDYSLDYLKCDYRVGADVPVENHHTDCRSHYSGIFSITLDNPGSVWLYVDLDCQNNWYHYYLPPNSTVTIPATINPYQELPENTCVFYDSDVPYVDIYSEESDWDYVERRLLCRRNQEVRSRDWVEKSFQMLKSRSKFPLRT